MKFHSTTILTVRHQGKVALGGDGQVTLGNTIMKADANKIRKLKDGNVLCGFAGSSADAFALLERFEAKLKDNPGNVPRAATELAKEWRMDRALRRLYTILERLLEDLSFEAPDMHMGRVEINAGYVKQRLEEVTKDEDLSKFIL